MERLKHLVPVNANNAGNLKSDLSAGVVSAVVGIPQGMAYALLAGVNPIYGLYTAIVSTAVAGLTTSSQFMNVALTNTLALAVGSALISLGGAADVSKLFALTLVVGLIQLGFGLAKLGDLTQFVSSDVMTGFVAGSALLIIMGQFTDLTGFQGAPLGIFLQGLTEQFPGLASNKVIQTFNTLVHPGQMSLITTLVGVGTIAAVIYLRKTRWQTFALIIALAGGSLVANIINLFVSGTSIQLVGDVGQIPPGLPGFYLPNLLESGFGIFYSAIAVAVLGMVQSASVSQSVPNPDGEYSDASRDFAGQGMANIVGSCFQCMPAGGSFSGTALNVTVGAKSRWANVFAGIFTGIIVLLLGGLVERIALPAMAGVLIVIGFMAFPTVDIQKVWKTNWSARLTMVVTFVATLSIPVQNAIYLGIVLSLILFIYTSSRRIRVVQITKHDAGHFEELPAPAVLPDHAVTFLNIYGSLYFGAVSTLEKLLPSAKTSDHSVVILRLRGRESLGSTLYRLLERYARQVQAGGGRLMLVGIDTELKHELIQTGAMHIIGPENVFDATSVLAESSEHAVAIAREWLESTEGKTRK